jgi:protocatechuate 3,4-dioxygenase beta subunit
MSRLWLVALVVALVMAAPTAQASSPAANACRPTPTDAFGPFGRGTPPFRSKIGTGHVLTGVVLSALDCRPLRRARVELWQANRNGDYTRSGSASVNTDSDGRFRFEGPLPPSYEGRPGHIHIRVFAANHQVLLARYVPPRGSRRGTIRLVLRPALV